MSGFELKTFEENEGKLHRKNYPANKQQQQKLIINKLNLDPQFGSDFFLERAHPGSVSILKWI